MLTLARGLEELVAIISEIITRASNPYSSGIEQVLEGSCFSIRVHRQSTEKLRASLIAEGVLGIDSENGMTCADV